MQRVNYFQLVYQYMKAHKQPLSYAALYRGLASRHAHIIYMHYNILNIIMRISYNFLNDSFNVAICLAQNLRSLSSNALCFILVA